MARQWTVAVFGLTTTVALGAAMASEEYGALQHPVLAHDIDPQSAAAHETRVRRVMAMSEAEMLALIPTKSCILFCGCPNCSGGQQENGQFEWTIDRPFALRCRFCSHVYPSGEYPMKSTATGVNGLGEAVTYNYYFDEKSGRDFWLEAHADHMRKRWFVRQCRALAVCYHLTKNGKYARRAALILDRFAQAYPHMAVLSQWPFRRRAIVEPTPPYPWTGGKWGRWMAAEVPQSLPEAYDLIYDSTELDRLTTELGVNVRRRIEDDFFRATVTYMLTFGKTPTGRHLNNMSPRYTRSIVHIGRVLGEPQYVHWGYHWVHEMIRDGFFYDGMWHEAPSYHYATLNGILLVLAALEGYSDPPGYRSPTDDLRLEDVHLQEQIPFLGKAIRAPATVAYPNGRICPAHDTWAASRPGAPRQETTSTLLPGFGQAAIGCGRNDDQIQVQLHFSGAYGHAHADNLHVSLFAKNAEMFSDIGYSHSKLRRWTTSTVGHNTVVIDRQEQVTQDSDGDLLMFLPDVAGVCVVEARGQRAYPRLAKTYRRQLFLVPVSDSDAYVVDLFRVEGGTTHDWLLHGSADDDMTADCSLQLTARTGTLLGPGERWVEPVAESSPLLAYGLIRQLHEARTSDSFQVTFRYPNAEGPTAAAGVRIHLDGGPATELYLGKSPRVRPAEGDDRAVYDHWMPQLVVRRRGQAPLASLFAAVHEPFRGEPFIDEVRVVPLDPPAVHAIGLEVHHGDVVDTIVSTLDAPPYDRRRLAGGVEFQGHLGLFRRRAGKVVAAWLVDGTRLAVDGSTLTCEAARWEGTIESATRKADGSSADCFMTAAKLPLGNALAGQWMIVEHGNGHTHGYEISSVHARDGKSQIVLRDDHGLRIAGDMTEQCYFPRRKITGRNRFVITGWATR